MRQSTKMRVDHTGCGSAIFQGLTHRHSTNFVYDSSLTSGTFMPESLSLKRDRKVSFIYKKKTLVLYTV